MEVGTGKKRWSTLSANQAHRFVLRGPYALVQCNSLKSPYVNSTSYHKHVCYMINVHAMGNLHRKISCKLPVKWKIP